MLQFCNPCKNFMKHWYLIVKEKFSFGNFVCMFVSLGNIIVSKLSLKFHEQIFRHENMSWSRPGTSCILVFSPKISQISFLKKYFYSSKCFKIFVSNTNMTWQQCCIWMGMLFLRNIWFVTTIKIKKIVYKHKPFFYQAKWT